MNNALRSRVAVVSTVVTLSLVGSGWAQTKIVAPKNSFTPAQDVEIGQKAAAEVRQQLPLVRDGDVQAYVDRIGRRLVAAVPAEFQHPGFRYSFQVVNASDINAFALPGGPMFVNRGMIAAARTEAEVAGVMAHELSHVLLRHGTAQASKAQKYQFGQLAGAIVGAIVGGTAGQVIAQGTQFGLGTAFLRYGREYEKQADLQGAQVMAAAGYDPRAMASMFKTIQQQEKSRAPEWMSSHPDPGNRVAYITKEAQSLQVADGGRDTGQLASVKAELSQMPAAPTTEQIMRRAEAQGGAAGGAQGEPGAVGTSGTLSPNVEPPSGQYETYNVGNVFRVSVPGNWRELQGNNSVTFAPEGGFGGANGSSVFTHGVEFGVTQSASPDLRTATQDLVQTFAKSNPDLRPERNARSISFAGRDGLQVTMRNRSEQTGNTEIVVLTTALLDEGNLFYSIGVAPEREFGQYSGTLQRVNQSVQLQQR